MKIAIFIVFEIYLKNLDFRKNWCIGQFEYQLSESEVKISITFTDNELQRIHFLKLMYCVYVFEQDYSCTNMHIQIIDMRLVIYIGYP